MTRVMSLIVGAAVSSTLLHAQDVRTDGTAAKDDAGKTPATITLVGCVRPDAGPVGTGGTATTKAAGQFVLTDIASPSGAETSARAPVNATGTDAGSPSGGSATAAGAGATGAGATGTSGATTTAATAGTPPTGATAIILEGAAIAPHLNQRVEVTGTYVKAGAAGPANDSGPSESLTGAGSGATPQRLQVSAVRRVVGTCGPQ